MTFAENNPLPEDGVLAVDDGETPEPDGTTAPVETPEPEGTPSSTGDTPPPAPQETPVDYAARVAEWGGEEAIADAIAIANALQDEDGVKALVEEGLKYLGHDPAKVFAGEVAPPPANPEDDDSDRLMTAAEVEQMLAERDQAQHEQQQTAAQRSADEAALRSVENTITALEINDDAERRAVLAFANGYASPDERDPDVIARAIQQGHADYIAHLQKAAEAYVEQRKQKNDAVPTPLTSGGSPGGEEAPAPKNLEEAKEAARRALRATGDI